MKKVIYKKKSILCDSIHVASKTDVDYFVEVMTGRGVPGGLGSVGHVLYPGQSMLAM